MLFLRNLLWSYPGSILSLILFSSASITVSVFAKTGHTQHKISCIWARAVLWFCGIEVEVEGSENVQPGCSYVFAANHRSYLDSPIVLPFIDVQFRFFAKSSVFYWPMMGFHLRRSGHLPVHYDNPQKSLKSMSAAARVIQQKGISVLLFPEAGRTMGELEPFKDGAAYVAIKAGVPIVPVGLIGSLEILPTGAGKIRPGKVKIRIGKPIPTLDLTLSDRTRLTQTLWVKVAELIDYPVPEEKRGEALAGVEA